jgi:hypothetical protein
MEICVDAVFSLQTERIVIPGELGASAADEPRSCP